MSAEASRSLFQGDDEDEIIDYPVDSSPTKPEQTARLKIGKRQKLTLVQLVDMPLSVLEMMYEKISSRLVAEGMAVSQDTCIVYLGKPADR